MNPSEVVDGLIRGENVELRRENVLDVLQEAIDRLRAIRRDIKVEPKTHP